MKLCTTGCTLCLKAKWQNVKNDRTNDISHMKKDKHHEVITDDQIGRRPYLALQSFGDYNQYFYGVHAFILNKLTIEIGTVL